MKTYMTQDEAIDLNLQLIRLQCMLEAKVKNDNRPEDDFWGKRLDEAKSIRETFLNKHILHKADYETAQTS